MSFKEPTNFIPNQNEVIQQQGELIEQEEDSSDSQFATQQLLPPMDGSAVLEQLNLDENIKKIEYSLQGLRWDSEESKFVEHTDALLNDKGVQNIIRLCTAFLHKGLYLSNLDEDEVSKKMIDFRCMLTDELLLNFWNYEIQEANLEQIRVIVEYNFFFAIKRAFGQGDKLYLGKIQQMRTVESHNFMPEQHHKPGLLSRVFK